VRPNPFSRCPLPRCRVLPSARDCPQARFPLPASLLPPLVTGFTS